MTFEFYSFRFEFRAVDAIHFPHGKAGNTVRGAFGSIFRKIACVPQCNDVRTCELRASCPYARMFEPGAIEGGPSGLADWPRPFVFRAGHLGGHTINPGEKFHFDVNVFDMRDPALAYFVLTFAQLAREGIGPRRGRAQLIASYVLSDAGVVGDKVFDGETFLLKDPPAPISVGLEGVPGGTRRVSVRFRTPTELKGSEECDGRPEFGVLFARIRDRVSTLRSLYGAGPLEIDFRGMGSGRREYG